MQSKSWSVVLVLLGLVIGFTVGNGGMERQSNAQAPAPGGAVAPMPVGRYQISAWGHSGMQAGGPLAPQRGCYILDTATGVMWHATHDGSGGIPKKIVQQLCNRGERQRRADQHQPGFASR